MAVDIDVTTYDKTAILPVGSGYDGRRDSSAVFGVVLHSTNGNKSSTFAGEARFLSQSTNVSAHYLIGKDGAIAEIVPVQFVAWHAGASEYLGVKSWNRMSVGIEAHHAIGDEWPKAQLDAQAYLVRRLMRHWPIQKKYIALHRWVAVPLGRKTDPNDMTDEEWAAWIAAL